MHNNVSISDRAKAITALENEMSELFKQAQQMNQQLDILKEEFQSKVRGLSASQTYILDKIIALEDAVRKIVVTNVVY